MVKIMLTLTERFFNTMKLLGFSEPCRLAVACSGGPDSLALVFLAQHWAAAHGHEIRAITVDHGLRAESAEEALQVGRWLTPHGIRHAVLPWVGEKPRSNVQQAARQARYRLMSEYCAAHGITLLLTGHTRDDQAETFLLRLARGSGVDGLSAMAPSNGLYGLTLLRPLLKISKAELIAYLDGRQQPYIRDPSNDNAGFDRVKMRQLMPLLAGAGLTAERLSATAETLRRARDFLEGETRQFIAVHGRLSPEGYASLTQLPRHEELRLRVMAELLMRVGGHAFRPRLEELQRLCGAVEAPGFKSATLMGCVVTAHEGSLLIIREVKAVASAIALSADSPVLWDGRFQVNVIACEHGWTVSALKQEGWLELARAHGLRCSLPMKKILYTLPALRDGQGRLRAAPLLGFSTPASPACTVRFRGLFETE